jgi:hypothetical protein
MAAHQHWCHHNLFMSSASSMPWSLGWSYSKHAPVRRRLYTARGSSSCQYRVAALVCLTTYKERQVIVSCKRPPSHSAEAYAHAQHDGQEAHDIPRLSFICQFEHTQYSVSTHPYLYQEGTLPLKNNFGIVAAHRCCVHLCATLLLREYFRVISWSKLEHHHPYTSSWRPGKTQQRYPSKSHLRYGALSASSTGKLVEA